MSKDESYYTDLLERYLQNECIPREIEEVMNLLEEDASNRLLLSQLNKQFHHSFDENSKITAGQSNRIREALLQKVNQAPVVSMYKTRWRFVAAAAAVIILLSGGWYFLTSDWKKNSSVAKSKIEQKRFKDDVLPGGNKAKLTLADGSTILLDDAQDGMLTQQGDTKVIKIGGKLDYNPGNTESKRIVYNTLSTPRGGQYQIELPDGSQVWLNAASTLHFPTAFAGTERKVEIDGEAYFEVTKNKAMPFIVSVRGAEVQVLGTHFNVMAYQEENVLKTTLLEGSIKFVSGKKENLLKPGEQSQLTKQGEVKVVTGVDVTQVIAWKNGMFYFEKADIETVLRQMSRWYDVEVVYKSKRAYDPLNAEIPRNTKLSDALKVLELAGSAKFEIEGKKILVIQ